MKVTFFCILLVVIIAAYVEAQRCPNTPRSPQCTGGRDVGRGGRGCRPGRRWWYNGRACVEMPYRGCGGNRNRYCSKRQCDQRCARKG